MLYVSTHLLANLELRLTDLVPRSSIKATPALVLSLAQSPRRTLQCLPLAPRRALGGNGQVGVR